jgi:hypothetical protein
MEEQLTIVKCDTCKKTLRSETQQLEHLVAEGANLRMAYLNRKTKTWNWEKFEFKCSKYHFCGGRCLGKFIDQELGKVTAKIKE